MLFRSTGWVVMKCRVSPSRTLGICAVLHEEPLGLAFGDAAVRLKDGLKIHELGSGPEIYQRVHFCHPESPAACDQARAASAAFTAQLGEIDSMIRFRDCRGASALAREIGEPSIELSVSTRCSGYAAGAPQPRHSVGHLNLP